MVATDRVGEIFADARNLHADALEMLEQGKIRNAAEKAWGATKRATDALILARTGREPAITSQTTAGLRTLGRNDSRVQTLRGRYSIRITDLHGNCFYDGHCEPEDVIAEIIRDTARYIDDAEDMAGRG